MVTSRLRWFSKVGRGKHFPTPESEQGESVIDARGIPCRCEERAVGGGSSAAEGGVGASADGRRKLSCVILQETLEEKELLLREIHHRVKNNLQVISSLLSLQGRASRSIDAQRACEESQNRIKSIALIHELLYRSPSLSRICAEDYLKRLGTKLLSGFDVGGRIRLEIDSTAIAIDLDHAVPFGLMVNELYTNSMKHGFSDGRGGVITVKLQHHLDGEVVLGFADDGIGLRAEIDPVTHDSLGFRLIGNLVRQLDGTIEYERGTGFKCTVRFRMNRYSGGDVCRET